MPINVLLFTLFHLVAETFYINLSKHINYDKTVSKNAYGDDAVRLIIKTINNFSGSDFVKKCVEILSKGNPNDLEFMRLLFETACVNVKYLRDPAGHEIVYTPKLLIKMGVGDCKKFTTYIGAVLKAKGIDAVPKVVKYSPDADWQHIYIVSRNANGGYITLDPVNHCKFNQEVKYNKARLNYLDGTYSPIMNGNKLSLMGNLNGNDDSIMQGVGEASQMFLGDLENITGVGAGTKSLYDVLSMSGLAQDYMNGINDENQINGDNDSIGAKKTKAQKKARRGKFFHLAAKAALAPNRAAFLGLIALGGALAHTKLKINLAKKLAEAWQKDNGKKITDVWGKFGGERESIRKAIARASKVNISGIGFTQDGSMQIEGIGVVTAAAATAAIVAASTILIPILKLVKKDGHVNEKEAKDVEQGVEVSENFTQAAQGGFKPEAITAFANSVINKQGRELDGGGNQATQADIVRDAQSETPSFTKGAAEGAASPVKGYVDQQQDQEAEQSGRTAQNSNLPVKLNETPQAQGAKSMMNSIYNPTAWIQIALVCVAMGNFIKAPVWLINTCTSISITMVIVMSINLFINSKKSKYEN